MWAQSCSLRCDVDQLIGGSIIRQHCSASSRGLRSIVPTYAMLLWRRLRADESSGIGAAGRVEAFTRQRPPSTIVLLQLGIVHSCLQNSAALFGARGFVATPTSRMLWCAGCVGEMLVCIPAVVHAFSPAGLKKECSICLAGKLPSVLLFRLSNACLWCWRPLLVACTAGRSAWLLGAQASVLVCFWSVWRM